MQNRSMLLRTSIRAMRDIPRRTAFITPGAASTTSCPGQRSGSTVRPEMPHISVRQKSIIRRRTRTSTGRSAGMTCISVPQCSFPRRRERRHTRRRSRSTSISGRPERLPERGSPIRQKDLLGSTAGDLCGMRRPPHLSRRYIAKVMYVLPRRKIFTGILR